MKNECKIKLKGEISWQPSITMGLYIRNCRYYFKKQIKGKVYYKALNLKKGQEKLLSARISQVEEEILAEHYGIPYDKQEQILFPDYVKKYLKSKTHKRSLDRDEQRLKKIAALWEDLPLQAIGKPHIQRLEKHLFSGKLRPTTVNRYLELVRHLFNLAIEDGYVYENPARFYQPFVEDGERRALSREELVRVLSAAKEIQENPLSPNQGIIYDLVTFALNTGMRLSEIFNLKKSYIREDVVYYPILETKHRRRMKSKVSKVKLICLNSFAMDIVRRSKGKGEYVFPIKWRDSGTILHIVRKIRKLSGVEDFTFHQLRHTASTVLSSQVSLATAKQVLGHADIKTTLKYTHPEIEEQKKGVAKIGEYFSDLQGKA